MVGTSAVMAQGTGSMGQGTDQDKQFLMTASQSDLTEITLSQLALQKGTSPGVKKYAQKMITDHQKLEAQMKPFADQMSVPPATALNAEHQQLLDQLNQLSGAAFDKQYISDMSTSHHATLTAFQTELSSTTDTQLKPTVAKGEKVVAEHTKMADQMSQKMGGTASGM